MYFFESCLFLLFSSIIQLTQWSVFRKIYQNRRRYKYRRIRTSYYPNQHSKREATGYFTSKDEQDQDGKEYRKGSHYRSAQCFVDGFINDGGIIYSFHQSAIFPDSIVYNYSIVHRETDYR